MVFAPLKALERLSINSKPFSESDLRKPEPSPDQLNAFRIVHDYFRITAISTTSVGPSREVLAPIDFPSVPSSRMIRGWNRVYLPDEKFKGLDSSARRSPLAA
jgi:hypothetical protein